MRIQEKQSITLYGAFIILAVLPFLVFPIPIALPNIERAVYTLNVEARANFYTYLKLFVLVPTAFILFFSRIFDRMLSKGRKLNAVHWTLGAMAAVTVLAAAFSPYQDVVYLGLTSRTEGMWAWLAYLLIAFVMYDEDFDRETCIKLLKAFAWTLLPLFALGLSQNYGSNLMVSLQWLIDPENLITSKLETDSVYGIFGNTNYMGSYLAMAVPVVLGLFTMSCTRRDRLSYGALAASGIALMMMTETSGVVTAAATVSLLGALILHPGLSRRKLIELLVILMMGLGSAALFQVTGGRGVTLSHYLLIAGSAIASGCVYWLRQRYSIAMTMKRLGLVAVLLTVVITIGFLQLQASAKEAFKELYYNAVSIEDAALILDTDDGVYTVRRSGDHIVVEDSKKTTIAEYDGQTTKEFSSERVLGDIEFKTIKAHDFLYLKGKAIFGIAEDELFYIKRSRKAVGLDNPPHVNVKYMETMGNMRAYIWSRGVGMIGSSPLLGYGPDTFFVSFPQDEIGPRLHTESMNVLVDKPHNLYIMMGTSFGVLYLMGFFYLAARGLKRSLVSENPLYNTLTLAVAAFLVIGLVNDSYIQVTPAFFCLFGMLLSQSESEGAKTL